MRPVQNQEPLTRAALPTPASCSQIDGAPRLRCVELRKFVARQWVKVPRQTRVEEGAAGAVHADTEVSPDSNGFQHSRSSRHSNQFPTKPLKIELSAHQEIRTSLGDQGSQVRVLSPRFAAVSNAVKPAPADCNGFQRIPTCRNHPAGTSTHTLIDVLSCKTTLFHATFGGHQPRSAKPGTE
jgi:hypothetical protein